MLYISEITSIHVFGYSFFQCASFIMDNCAIDVCKNPLKIEWFRGMNDQCFIRSWMRNLPKLLIRKNAKLKGTRTFLSGRRSCSPDEKTEITNFWFCHEFIIQSIRWFLTKKTDNKKIVKIRIHIFGIGC